MQKLHGINEIDTKSQKKAKKEITIIIKNKNVPKLVTKKIEHQNKNKSPNY